jgi:hypothetical protein
VYQVYFSKKLSLRILKNLQAPQALLSAHTTKSLVLPVLKEELTGFWQAQGFHNMP